MAIVINPISGKSGVGLQPTIRAYAPEGSTVTCAGQEKVVGAAGYVDFVVDIGTYTVTATLNGKTAVEEVTVDEIGLFDVELEPGKLWLYKYGDERESITGGWHYNGKGSATGTKLIDCFDNNCAGLLGVFAAFTTTNEINLANYSKLCVTAIGKARASSNDSCAIWGVLNTANPTNLNGSNSEKKIEGGLPVTTPIDTVATIETDISAINSGFVSVYTVNYRRAFYYAVWLE